MLREEYAESLLHEQEQTSSPGQSGAGTPNFKSPPAYAMTPTESFSDLTLQKDYFGDYSGGDIHALKPIFIQGISELMDELEHLYLNISNQALDHIHAREIIMTSGQSRTVE